MAKSDIWMPLYIGDYLRATMHLSTEEHGAYLLLLMSCWDSGGELDNDPDALASVARLPLERWLAMSRKVLRFFADHGAILRHPRVDKELERSKEKSRKAAESAAKRWTDQPQDDANAYANALRTDMRTQCERNARSDANAMLPQSQSQSQSETQPESLSEGVPESITAHQVVIQEFNAVAPVRCTHLTDKRRKAMAQRLRDRSWNWRAALDRIPDSDFLSGRAGNWKGCTIDFFLRPDTVTRILEGAFDNGSPQHRKPPPTSQQQFAGYTPNSQPEVPKDQQDEVPF